MEIESRPNYYGTAEPITPDQKSNGYDMDLLRWFGRQCPTRILRAAAP